jgi:hypothetical protein
LNFIAAVHHQSKSMLDSVVNMDKTMACYHTPKTKKKKQSKQWISRDQQDPLKAWVHSSQTKHMVVAFFYSLGLIYIHFVP